MLAAKLFCTIAYDTILELELSLVAESKHKIINWK